MRLLMVGPPGAGKGTQSRRLAAHFGIEHLASGELLRAEVGAGTDIGKAVAAAIEAGDLVPDDVMLEVIGRRLLAAAKAGGYVLDGYPRTLGQAREAHRMALEIGGIELQAVVHLHVGRDELRRRMMARAEEEGRSDDTRRVIDHRLEVFDAQTEPLLGYYEDRRLLRTVDGARDVDDVTGDILRALAPIEA